jgi:multidrug efflux system membrane fusion protein
MKEIYEQLKQQTFWQYKKLLISFVVIICIIAAYYLVDSHKKSETVLAPVEVMLAEQKDVPHIMEFPGNIEAYHSVAIKSLVDGQIMEVKFTEGQNVKKGDLLFVIDSRGFVDQLNQAIAKLERDKALLENAKNDEKRYQILSTNNVVSMEAYQQKQTDVSAIQADIDADQAVIRNAQLKITYSNITSPIDGKTGPIFLKSGNLVKANDTNPLVIINTISPVYAVFAVPEQYLDIILKSKNNNALALTVVTESNEKFNNGLVVFIDNQVNANTGTILLKGEMPNKNSVLWPGQYVKIYLQLYIQKNAVVIDPKALQQGQEGQYVFVINKNDNNYVAEMRSVKVDFATDDYVVISKGINSGEMVVTDGQIRLEDGTNVKLLSKAGE